MTVFAIVVTPCTIKGGPRLPSSGFAPPNICTHLATLSPKATLAGIECEVPLVFSQSNPPKAGVGFYA